MAGALRVSYEEAVKRGWIKDVPPEAIKPAQAPRLATPARADRDPQQILFATLKRVYGERVQSEYKGIVPGRRFRIDCAFPAERLAIEVDGFAFHRSLDAFKKDRARNNLIVVHGWRLLHYTANRIFNEMPLILDEVSLALKPD